MSEIVPVSFQDRGYVATLPDGSTVVSLSLAGLKKRLPTARLVLDRKAKVERDQRRQGGHAAPVLR